MKERKMQDTLTVSLSFGPGGMVDASRVMVEGRFPDILLAVAMAIDSLERAADRDGGKAWEGLRCLTDLPEATLRAEPDGGKALLLAGALQKAIMFVRECGTNTHTEFKEQVAH